MSFWVNVLLGAIATIALIAFALVIQVTIHFVAGLLGISSVPVFVTLLIWIVCTCLFMLFRSKS